MNAIRAKGVTLIELMIALAILAVAPWACRHWTSC